MRRYINVDPAIEFQHIDLHPREVSEVFSDLPVVVGLDSLGAIQSSSPLTDEQHRMLSQTLWRVRLAIREMMHSYVYGVPPR